MGNPAAGAKLWMANAVKILPVILKSRSVARWDIVRCFTEGGTSFFTLFCINELTVILSEDSISKCAHPTRRV